MILALLLALAAPSAAKTYTDPVFPFTIEVPANWTSKLDGCHEEIPSVGLVRRVRFERLYSRKKPFPMLEISFYAKPSRLTPRAAQSPNQETIELGGRRWIKQVYGSSRKTICLSPQVEGLNARVCPLGLPKLNAFEMGPAEFARMDQSEREVYRALETFRWIGPVPDSTGMNPLCPGARPVTKSELSDDEVQRRVEFLAKGLRFCAQYRVGDPEKADCSAFRQRKTVEEMTALGPRAARAILRERYEEKDVGVASSLTSALYPLVARSPELAEDLRRYLKVADPALRRDAIKLLRGLGAPAKPAIPEIRRLLDDPDSNVRFEAQRALEALDPPAR